ncbi:DNA polymerase III beta subunit [hydrothermal vent metagenome]|uniref:DNA polymerase III beta subunit n=1 Tax=hydrothermal vent metagenome TaxID=652676 RepID=A0A3B1CW14_9ZZZZ
MEFTIGRDELFKGLQRAQGVVSAKGPMPILANVLIEAHETGINIFATNLDMGLLGAYEGQVKSPGKITVQAKKLHDIARELPSEDITIKTDDDGRLRISCGKAKFNLATISADEFPAFPKYEDSNFIKLDSAMISEMIAKTSYAISQDETRLTLNGAYFEVGPTNTLMVATDGHRLAYINREGAFKVSEPVKSIIARKAIVELSKLIGDDSDPVEFLKQDNHVVFKKGSLVMVARLIEGAYPNYEQVIPKSHTHEISIDISDFKVALRKVSVLADEKSHMIRLDFSEGKLELISEGGELGEARDEAPIEYSGEGLVVGLNAYYLLDLLNIMPQKKVIIKTQDALSPVLAQAPGDDSLLCIVMPMRL